MKQPKTKPMVTTNFVDGEPYYLTNSGRLKRVWHRPAKVIHMTPCVNVDNSPNCGKLRPNLEKRV